MPNVRIPTPLRKYTQGLEVVSVAGDTVAAVLGALEEKCPGIRERICDDSGKVRRFVNVFVGEEDIRFLSGLDTDIAETDAIRIIPSIAGG